MTSSCFEIDLVSVPGSLASRAAGLRLKSEIKAAISTHDLVVVDFNGREVTPSFADECFGALAEEFGLNEFKARVRSKNVPSKARALLSHVIKQRVQGALAQCVDGSALPA